MRAPQNNKNSEMSWRMKEALAGRLTYDGGGRVDTALRANFDVVNLVSPGPFYQASSLPLVPTPSDKGNSINNNNNSSSTNSSSSTATFRIPAVSPRRKRSATTLAADNQTHLVAVSFLFLFLSRLPLLCVCCCCF